MNFAITSALIVVLLTTTITALCPEPDLPDGRSEILAFGSSTCEDLGYAHGLRFVFHTHTS